MKKVMKFVKGKKEEETPVKIVSVETKKIVNEKIDEVPREDDFISRDKTITKLHKAVWNENSDKLKSIIKTHDIDITDKLDRTALYFAVLKNNPNIVNLLLENSANQNIPDIDGITPFLKSVQLGYKQCAANLLNHGADIKKTDKDSNSCLHFAIMGKQIDILSFLLEYNADCNVPNVNGEYPLHIAIQLQDKQMVEILLNYNSDINVVNNSGLTPLMLAEKQNNSDIIELLENYSLKNSKDNNLFPDEISHKSSYENVNTPKIELKSPKVESDSDTWNESPVTTPSKKLKKPLTQVSKFFNDEIEIAEEKSESDVSVKCSENTSPQSGIIPPPCKPLRSLEYLQSGLSIENRPVHLLTLGTVRTRHISMTESDHSKNNTPHRYSYQGDLQGASGDSFQKLPDISTADEKGDSVNISIKSKLLSKLECDSTIQSDWGSNESLPLDELSIGGKKEKSTTSSTSKNNSNNSNSGSIRDKSTDIFLQKQFSLLEDYEKNRDKRCSVSYEMDLLTVKMNENKNNSDSHLDDIDNLLEDNNRINTQLEKYAGQTDTLASGTKSKSLPRNCEPYNSYHKGSFSLPRTLESGKDPYREMRSYGYFKPRSHFSFSLKMLKGEKKSGFIDKLKSMFNKKSQIHLTEQNENGTWLYKKTDNEYYSTKAESFSGTESIKKSDTLPTSKTLNNFPDLKDDASNDDPSCSNNEQNKVIEKKISMNTQSRLSSTSSDEKICRNCHPTEDESKMKRSAKSLYSMITKDGVSFCEECDYLTQKLSEAEQNILSKEHFIHLLQNQLENLKNWNIKSIDESQEIYFKYAVAKQELDKLKHIYKKVNDEMDKQRNDRSSNTTEVTKWKEEANKWKKQYDELLATTKQQVPSMVPRATDEEKWRSIIQDEVSTGVNMLKENTQVVVSSLEKQNKKLETMIEKLQTDLAVAADREDHLQKQLSSLEQNVDNAKISEKDYEKEISILMMESQSLKEELEEKNRLYATLQKEYEDILMKNEKDQLNATNLNEELDITKEDYRMLARSLSALSEEIAKAKENALLKNEILQQQVAEIAPSSNMTEFINEITDKLETIEMGSDSKSEQGVSEQVAELSSSVADVEKIHKLNSDIELKILEVKTCKQMNMLIEENGNLQDMLEKTTDELKMKCKECCEKIETLLNEAEMNKEVILEQNLEISNLVTELEFEKKQCEQVKCDCYIIQGANQELRTSLIETGAENDVLKSEIISNSSELKTLEEENINMKSSITELQNENNSLQIQLSEAMDTINGMKELMEDSQQRLEKLEKVNKELQQEIDFLKEKDSKFEKKPCDKVNCDCYIIQGANQELGAPLIETGAENDALKSEIISNSSEYKSLEEENINMKSSITELQNVNNYLEIQLNEAMDTINGMKDLIEDSQQRLAIFEKLNKELQQEIDYLKEKDGMDKNKSEEFEDQISNLVADNTSLTKEIEEEKEVRESVILHVDSLQFHQRNDTKLSIVRFDDRIDEGITFKNNMQTEIEKLSDINKQLHEKLNIIETENKELQHNILELNQEIGLLGEKLQNTDILQYTQKYVDALDSATKENQELKAAISALHDILETKLSEKVENVTEQLLVERKKNKDVQEITMTSSPIVSQQNIDRALEERVSSVEEKIDELVEIDTNDDNDKKSLSMPNLEEIPSQKENYLIKEKLSNSLKSTSFDNVTINEDKCCAIKWEKQLACIQQLREELADILYKLSNQKRDCSQKIYYSEKYKDMVDDLELQVCNIQTSDYFENIDRENDGTNPKLEEINRLRKELYKQKVERMRGSKIPKRQWKEDIFNTQLKAQYLESKQKLLKDLSTVQDALKEEMEVKSKCDVLVKKVTANQEARKKKLQEIAMISIPKPSTSVVKKVKICEIPDTSPPKHEPGCFQYPEKPVKPRALVIKAKKRINVSFERQRVSSSESVPDSSSDDEMRKKYLLQ